MKIQVTKLGAARSQLIEAINLFFEERDPVSIHTLVGAALEILNDHISYMGNVWKYDLISHYDTIRIKDEYRKEWYKKINEARNFFKHVDRHLKVGKVSLEFETELNELFILDAIHCMSIVDETPINSTVEFNMFIAWLGLKHPNYFKEEANEFFNNADKTRILSVDGYKGWKEAIRIAKLRRK